MSDDIFETMLVGETRYFRTKLVKNGPYVPVALWIKDGERDPQTKELISDQLYGATIAGEETQDYYEICRRARFWEKINKSEFEYLISVMDWAQQNDAADPLSAPRKAINLRGLPAPF